MSYVVLFHSIYGLRPAVREAAERLTQAGHTVVTPDLFDGRVVDDVSEGMAIRDEIGMPALLKRAEAAAADVPAGAVFAGFSLGAFLADHVAARAEAPSALVMLHGPGDIRRGFRPIYPVQAHIAIDDEYEDDDYIARWADAFRAAGGSAEVFRYEGGHLYTDSGLPDYNADSAELTWQRVLAFLNSSTSR